VEYVNGKVHTNGMENFWSLLKRGLHGTYVSVEPFHLFRYLDEQTFRFNKRHTTDADRFVQLCSNVAGKRLDWNTLTGKSDSSRPDRDGVSDGTIGPTYEMLVGSAACLYYIAAGDQKFRVFIGV
jgi:hypothetical protein